MCSMEGGEDIFSQRRWNHDTILVQDDSIGCGEIFPELKEVIDVVRYLAAAIWETRVDQVDECLKLACGGGADSTQSNSFQLVRAN